MLKAKHHIVIYPLFQRLTVFLLKRNFKLSALEDIEIAKYFKEKKKILQIEPNYTWIRDEIYPQFLEKWKTKKQ